MVNHALVVSRQRPHPASRSLRTVALGCIIALVFASTFDSSSLALPVVRQKLVARRLSAPGGSDGTGSVSAVHVSDARFDQLPISEATKRAVSEGFGYEFMTEVQAQTVGPILKGTDVLARAKTGTGKTLGFLIPAIELITNKPSRDRGAIQALIISPTRELASQIYKEAELLLSFHEGYRAVCVFGGTKIKKDQQSLNAGPCSVLIATPGRLQDHLSNTPGFVGRLSSLRVLILDEADQLLDMGFRQNIREILQFLPPADTRQGLLFSATFPAQVSEMAGLALSSGYRMINTVKPEDESTPEQIAQFYAIVPTEEITRRLWDALQTARDRDPENFKIVVFFTTARLVGYYADVFRQTSLRDDLFEIHSRKSQAYRTKESERFRSVSRGILFSSDVSARGLDYPGVTMVIQVGAPSSKDQYIHRLGRTGRAGKSGLGLLLLHDFEGYFPRALRDMPLQKADLKEVASKHSAPEDFSGAVSMKVKAQAYSAWLGYYKGKLKDMSMRPAEVVSEANRFAASIDALDLDGRPPPIPKRTVGKMGLKGVPGLNLVAELPAEYR